MPASLFVLPTLTSRLYSLLWLTREDGLRLNDAAHILGISSGRTQEIMNQLVSEQLVYARQTSDGPHYHPRGQN